MTALSSGGFPVRQNIVRQMLGSRNRLGRVFVLVRPGLVGPAALDDFYCSNFQTHKRTTLRQSETLRAAKATPPARETVSSYPDVAKRQHNKTPRDHFNIIFACLSLYFRIYVSENSFYCLFFFTFCGSFGSFMYFSAFSNFLRSVKLLYVTEMNKSL